MNNLMLLEEAGTFGQINAVLSLLYAPATLALCLVGVASRRFAPRLVLPLVLMALVPVLVSLIGVEILAIVVDRYSDQAALSCRSSFIIPST